MAKKLDVRIPDSILRQATEVFNWPASSLARKIDFTFPDGVHCQVTETIE